MNGTAKFIKFQTGALLRSDELNTSFDYAKAKDKLSNRLLDGAGIVQGLNVTWANNTLTISEGVGVTSDGQLLYFESRTFNTINEIAPKEIKDAIIKSLPSFSGVSELTQGDGKTSPLTLDFLKDKCIFLYPTATTSNLADCSLRTDQKNQICTDDIKVLIGTPTTKNNTDEKTCLQTPCLLRLGDTGKEAIDFSSFTNAGVLETEYKKIIDKNIGEIVNAYTTALACYGDLFCGVLFSDLSKMLTEQWGLFSKTTILYPYFNDYLKTLAAAYEEFANTEGVYKKWKIVESNAFPNYLSLGNGNNCACRHYWQPSPANSDAYKEAMFYARRMVALVNSSNLRFEEIIKDVATPNATGSDQQVKPIRITPSHTASMPLSERAIPFYFKSTEVKKYWNFKLSNLILTQDIPSYDDAENKILCENIKGYDFYRIENAIGQRAKSAIEDLIKQKQDFNLAFDIKAVVIGDKPPLSIYFEDLQRQYYNIRLQIVCAIQDYIDNDNRIKLSASILPIGLPFLLSTFCNNSKLFENLQNLKQVTKMLCYIPLLEDLCEAYKSRLNDYLFPQFAKKQTGLDYCGGVPKGGTWVMLINDAPREEARVIAHFALPAQCCVEDNFIKCLFGRDILNTEITDIKVQVVDDKSGMTFNFETTVSNSYAFIEWSVDGIPEKTERIDDAVAGKKTHSKTIDKSAFMQHNVALRIINPCSEAMKSMPFEFSAAQEDNAYLSEIARRKAETLREQAEENRKKSEDTRVVSEGTRVTAEGTRVVSEGTRVVSEGTRVLSEGTRVLSEGTRVVSEGTRVASEGTRVLSEGTRVASEGTRITAEGIRNKAEGVRSESEVTRVASEGTRNTAEGVRGDSEGKRKVEEAQVRVIAENNRVIAENARVEAEKKRVEAEDNRNKKTLVGEIKVIPNSDIDPSTVFKPKGRELSIQESEITESTASEGIDKQLRQRHDSYRKLIDEIEKDEAINDNKAFNLTKVFVFFPKPKAAFTANFEETIQALFASINRSKKEQQQQKLTALLQTATHFYLDKIIAAGEPIDNATNAIAIVKDFMIKKGMNTSEFIANWKSAAIETDENKELIAQLMQLFE